MSETPALDDGQEVQQFYQLLGRNTVRIANLEAENALLRGQLNDALLKIRHFQEPKPDLDPNHHSAEAELITLKQAHDDLRKRHDALQAKQERVDERVRKADAKYEAAKKNAQQWKAYIDRKWQQQQANGGASSAATTPATPGVPPDVLPTSEGGVTPSTVVRRQYSGEGEDEQALPTTITDGSSVAQSQAASKNPSDTSGMAPRSSPPTSTQPTKRITSSQTTEADQSIAPDVRAMANQQSSSDGELEIVSERVVSNKRKRSDSRSTMPPPRRIKEEPVSPKRPGSAGAPFEIKSEGHSSPIPERNPVMRIETSDLDGMIGPFDTPKRRQLKQVAGARAMSEEATRPTYLPPRLIAANSSSLSDGDLDELEDRAPVFQKPVGVDHDQQETQHAIVSVNRRPFHNPIIQPRQRRALHQLSPNVPTPSKAPKGHSDRIERAKKAAILAEDGDEDASQVTPKSKTSEPPKAKTTASHRLEAMLERATQSDSREPLPKRPTLEPKQRPLRRPQGYGGNLTPDATALTISRPTTTPSNPRRPNLEKSPPPIRPEEEPLRLKPPTALTLADFRINPAYSDTSFAHATSIRDKATKACLPSCTRPECCGQWATAARLGTLPPSSKTRAEILADYLGPTWASLMQGFSEAKRRETWIQAQAQDAANVYGKHKVLFERARSPPGFWRTEMPSTQEEEEDRRKAGEREREKVEERWREALREGGRWRFRDEMPDARATRR